MDNLDVFERLELAQTRPSGTSAVSTYVPSSKGILQAIYVANTTGSVAAFSIYVDQNGTTYDQTTALFYQVEIAANSTVVIDEQLIPITSAGNVAVQTDTSNALTFTFYGIERTQ